MAQPQGVKMRETPAFSGMRSAGSRDDFECVAWTLPARRVGIKSSANWLSTVLILVSLAISGCVTAAKSTREGLFGASSSSRAASTTGVPLSGSMDQMVQVARLQSPTPEVARPIGLPAMVPLPPLPEPGLPATASDPDSVSVAAPPVDAATGPPPLAAMPVAPAAPPAGSGGAFGYQSLSSIARNRLANRVPVAPLADSGGMLSDAAAGRLTRGSVRPADGRDELDSPQSPARRQ